MRIDATIKEYQEEQDKIINSIISGLMNAQINIGDVIAFNVIINHERMFSSDEITLFRKVHELRSPFSTFENHIIIQHIFEFEERFQTEIKNVSVAVQKGQDLEKKVIHVDFSTYCNKNFNEMRDDIGFVKKGSVKYVNLF